MFKGYAGPAAQLEEQNVQNYIAAFQGIIFNDHLVQCGQFTDTESHTGTFTMVRIQ